MRVKHSNATQWFINLILSRVEIGADQQNNTTTKLATQNYFNRAVLHSISTVHFPKNKITTQL